MNRAMMAVVAGTVLGAAGVGLAKDLRSDGAFGFPQKSARVLCDTEELRLSAVCDGVHLFVQAILWKDGDSTDGLTDDGRKIGDNSTLIIDADADGKPTRDIDRNYTLNPWPALAGLHYSVVMGAGMSTGLQADSKGRGSIQYVDEGRKKIRVDNYHIPIGELKSEQGKDIRLAFWASSAAPEFRVNSVGYGPKDPAAKYWPHHLPAEKHHTFALAKMIDGELDGQTVPEGRGTIAVKAKQKPPAVGTMVGTEGGPPEISAAAWKNWKSADGKPPTLAGLRGKVVAVEFWATWCGPCVAGIPHLNELHTRHKDEGLVILSLTDQAAAAVEKFVEARGDGMSYPIGMGSETGDAYGVSGIPQAFVIDRTGKLVWEGHPADKGFDAAIAKALKEGK